MSSKRWNAVATALVLWLFLAGDAVAGQVSAREVRSAVEAFVARLGAVEIRDVAIDQEITLYHPDGLHPRSHGEQRVLMKPPGRQRIEQTIDGQREIRLVTGGRAWLRRPDGVTHEVPQLPQERQSTEFLMPLRRSVDDLLAEWRALGVRDDIGEETRVGGRTVLLIGTRVGTRDVPAVWLDPEHGVVRFVGRQPHVAGALLLDLAFSEHRPVVGGLWFPYRQEVFLGGKLVLLITIRSVTVNADIPDRLFDPESLRAER